MQNIDRNIEKMVEKTLMEEDRILHDLEEIEDEMHLKKKASKKTTKAKK